MLFECSSLDWPCSLLLDPTWTTLAATEMDGTTSGESARESHASSFSSNLVMRFRRCSGTHAWLHSLHVLSPLHIIVAVAGALAHYSTCTQISVLQLPEGVLQGLLQLHAAACSDPALPDHPFSGSHHLVCLHWKWLLCGPHPLVKYHQHHTGHQPGLHHCITRPVDCCLACLHGQCCSGH